MKNNDIVIATLVIMKIHLGMPVYQGIHPEVVKNLIDFDLNRQRKQNELSIQFPRSSVLSRNRNLIVETALNNGADWILMWDSDTAILQKDFLGTLIDRAEYFKAHVIGVPVRIKTKRVIYNCADKEKNRYSNWIRLKNITSHVDVVGAAVMLINTSWLKYYFNIGPWFSFQDTKTGFFPEDWTFCERVRKRKGIIIVEPSIKTIHYGECEYS